jgi:hypothetical protein
MYRRLVPPTRAGGEGTARFVQRLGMEIFLYCSGSSPVNYPPAILWFRLLPPAMCAAQACAPGGLKSKLFVFIIQEVISSPLLPKRVIIT